MSIVVLHQPGGDRCKGIGEIPERASCCAEKRKLIHSHEIRTRPVGYPPSMFTMFVCSSGGHLMQLHALRPWWGERRRMWVTFDKPDARSLLSNEDVEWAHHPTTRNLKNALANLLLAWRLLRERRPDVVVSNGAGVAFPFFLVAKLLGIATVYVEVFDRIDSPTLTGRLCYPFSSLFLLQWPEQGRFYRKGLVIGRLI